MKITYLFLVYKNAEIVFHTCQKLSAKGISFFVHVDKNSQVDFSILKNIENLEISEARYPTSWGSSGLVEATAYCLNHISKSYDTDYVILMSESDYPVKSTEYIAQYLEESKKDFATCSPLPCEHPLENKNCYWLEGGMRRVKSYPLRFGKKGIASIEPRTYNWGNIRQFGKLLLQSPCSIPSAFKLLFYPKRKPLDNIPWCGGDQWFILRKKTVDRIVGEIDCNELILREANNTIVPDEIIFPTLINMLSPSEERENRILRYVHWSSPKAKSPSVLSMNDTSLVDRLVENMNILFVRKVDSMDIVEYIDSRIK